MPASGTASRTSSSIWSGVRKKGAVGAFFVWIGGHLEPTGPVTVRGRWLIDPDPNGPITIRSPGRWPDTARSAAQASGADGLSLAANIPAFKGFETARQAFMTPDARFRFGCTPGCTVATDSMSGSGPLGRAARGVRPTAGATNRYVTPANRDQSTMGGQPLRAHWELDQPTICPGPLRIAPNVYRPTRAHRPGRRPDPCQHHCASFAFSSPSSLVGAAPVAGRPRGSTAEM